MLVEHALLKEDQPMMWYRFELTQIGVNKDTKEPIMSMEFRPVFGTRREFLEEFIAQLELYIPHKQDDRLQRNNLWRSMEQIMLEKENPTVAMLIADYAAQFETTRWTTPTCGVKSSHNNCVMVISCKPEQVKKVVRKWGRREASVEDVTRNHCAVIYGIFSNRHKPSAYHYNLQLEDLLYCMKYGWTLHGEWFIRGLRVPRKRRGIADGKSIPKEPSDAGECSAVNGKRLSIWFDNREAFFDGIVVFDTELVEHCLLRGKDPEMEKDNSGPAIYLVTFDDGESAHKSWYNIQVGFLNLEGGGFVDVPHQYPLPSGANNDVSGKQWSLRDASTADLAKISVPVFPEMEDIIEDTDGCASQFQGQTNAGRVARSASSFVAVRRKSVISIAQHGKNHCDHQGFTMDQNLKELTLTSEAPVVDGTRAVVEALAQHRPAPTETHESKNSPWAPKDTIYAYYDDILLKGKHQHFKSYSNSKFYHSRTGMQKDATTAESRGPLTVNRIHCSCDKCKAPLYDFPRCLVRSVVGRSDVVNCVRVRGAAATTTQTQALADFAMCVRKGSCWPVRVEEDQEGEEGPFWLAMIKEDPERLEEDKTFAGQVFKVGWIVAKACWCSFMRERGTTRTPDRVYKELVGDETYVSLNHLVRLDSPVKIRKDAASKAKQKQWILEYSERKRIEEQMT